MNHWIPFRFTRVETPKRPQRPWLSVLLALCLAMIACGQSSTDELASALPPTEGRSEPTRVAQDQGEGTSPTATVPNRPTQEPPTPVQEQLALEIESQGFGQDERSIGYGFVILNPNAGLAFVNTQYQVAAYDGNDTVIETDSGYITFVLPQQRLGVGGTLFVDDGVTISRIEVQLSDGDTEMTDVTTPFEVSGATYREGEYFSYVRGIITNPYTVDMTQLRVSAIIFDETGAIIGGGFTFANFALSQSPTGVEISVTSAAGAASAEIFPVMSGLSTLTEPDPIPAGAEPPVIEKQGFGQEDYRVGVGLVVANPNPDYSIERTMYRTTLYGENDAVVSVVEGYLDVLLPDQTIGLGGDALLDEGVTVVRSESQVLAGRFEASDPLPGFTAENVAYIPGRYSSQVTGEIVSPYSRDITNLRVSAIAYDGQGEIIGGGFTFLDFVPAEGRAAVEVTVTAGSDPASVELFGVLSGLSDIK